MPSTTITRTEIRAAHEARWNETNGQYPQYAGWLETAVLVQVRRRIRTKGGLAFLAKQHALAWRCEADLGAGLAAGWTCHSLQLGWNVRLGEADVVVVG